MPDFVESSDSGRLGSATSTLDFRPTGRTSTSVFLSDADSLNSQQSSKLIAEVDENGGAHAGVAAAAPTGNRNRAKINIGR